MKEEQFLIILLLLLISFQIYKLNNLQIKELKEIHRILDEKS